MCFGRRLTEKPHIAGEQADFDLVTYLKKTLKDYGLDSVRTAPYDVLLSYPDQDHPNSVQLLNDSGQVVFDSLSAESNITHQQGVVPPFNAYSPARQQEVGRGVTLTCATVRLAHSVLSTYIYI